MKVDPVGVSSRTVERRRPRARSPWSLAVAAATAVRRAQWSALSRAARRVQASANGDDFLELAHPTRNTTWGVGEQAVQWWWSDLSPAQRARARCLSPAELLPDGFVVSLLLYGVELDTVSDPTRVPQPPALRKLLHGERQEQHVPTRVDLSA